MFSEVREHVEQGISHFSRRGQRSPVPAIRPKSSVSAQQIVHVAGNTHGNTPNPTRERPLVRSLYDEMQVITLDRKVNEAKTVRVAARCTQQREAHRRENELGSERSNAGAQRDVHRLV
jgi:hypothetical protein